jgi:hypothetical protein
MLSYTPVPLYPYPPIALIPLYPYTLYPCDLFAMSTCSVPGFLRGCHPSTEYMCTYASDPSRLEELQHYNYYYTTTTPGVAFSGIQLAGAEMLTLAQVWRRPTSKLQGVWLSGPAPPRRLMVPAAMTLPQRRMCRPGRPSSPSAAAAWAARRRPPCGHRAVYPCANGRTRQSSWHACDCTA